MCTSGENISESEEILLRNRTGIRNENKFGHLYKEKFYYISKRNNQTLCTGYRPDSNAHFKFRIRIDDHRYGDYLMLTLFQYVNLLRDLREFLYTNEEIKLLDEVDASIKFSFKDINVPKVTIEVDASYSTPNLFQLNLLQSNANQISTIVLNRKTIKRLIECEGDIINTIETLEDRSTNFLFNSFVEKCVEYLKNEKIEIDAEKIFNEIKSLYKTSFQSEIFLKFWSLLYKLIESKLSESQSSHGSEI